MGARWKSSVVYGTLAALLPLLAIAGFAYLACTTRTGVNDAYAMWGAADMVIDYMETHDGQWPRSWQDLRPQFQMDEGRVPGWSFSEFQGRIAIDFEADARWLCEQAVESPRATFRVVWANGSHGVRIGDGPNQMLCDYFRRKAETKQPQNRSAGED
jgi:hypothetical protein